MNQHDDVKRRPRHNWYKKHSTIWIDDDTKWQLLKLKAELRVTTINDLIKLLIENYTCRKTEG